MARANREADVRTREAVTYLKSAEVAEALGITKRTLKNWLRNGKAPEPKRNPANRYRLWTLGDVEEIRRLLREDSPRRHGEDAERAEKP
jgi:transcriptional regulator with XRE-family HTH domain